MLGIMPKSNDSLKIIESGFTKLLLSSFSNLGCILSGPWDLGRPGVSLFLCYLFLSLFFIVNNKEQSTESKKER